MTKSARDSNLELLRIVAMMCIVLHHFIVHGYQLSKFAAGHHSVFPFHNHSLANILLSANAFLIIGVNVFILISGYFSIKLKWRSVLNLILACIFYDYLQMGADTLINHQQFHLFDPIIGLMTRSGWFITCYFALCLLSPAINKIADNSTTKERLTGLLSLILINCWFGYYFNTNSINDSGYNLIHFIFIYYLGRTIYCYRALLNANALLYLLGYLLCSGATAGLAVMLFQQKEYRTMWFLFHYNNPLVIGAALCLFLTFLNLSFKSTIINWIAGSMLAVYLIHESPFISRKLYGFMYDTFRTHGYFSTETICVFLCLFLAILSGSIFIDKIRILITKPIIQKAATGIENGFLSIEKTISNKCKSTNK